MAKNAEMILSHIHEILSGAQPFVAYNQYPKLGPERKSDRIFEFSLEELSQRNMVQTMVDIIKELKTCHLNDAQFTKVKRLEYLLRVIKKYSSTKQKINSIDDFLATQMARKTEYLRTRENYAKMWRLEDELREEAKRYRLELTDTEHKLEDLKANWLQMGFHAGCSQSDLMANDIELHRLEKEHDRLVKLCYEKAAQCRKLFKKKKEMSEALKGMISNSFDELANLKEIEKELACQELAKIERSWGFISNASPS